MPINQLEKKGVVILANINGPDCQGETISVLPIKDKKESVWNAEDILSLLFIPRCYAIIFHKKKITLVSSFVND